MFVLDKNKLYIYSEDKNKKMRLLGDSIDLSNKIIIPFRSSVSKGKLVAAYLRKDIPTSIIVDDSGYVYSVSKESKNGFSIKTLGVSSSNQPGIN